jgi:hypothetical protein
MALPDAPLDWRKALTFAEEHLAVAGGFDFNGDRDGVWVEGTGQAALAYRIVGNTARNGELVKSFATDLTPSGLLNATRVYVLQLASRGGPAHQTPRPLSITAARILLRPLGRSLQNGVLIRSPALSSNDFNVNCSAANRSALARMIAQFERP